MFDCSIKTPDLVNMTVDDKCMSKYSHYVKEDQVYYTNSNIVFRYLRFTI